MPFRRRADQKREIVPILTEAFLGQRDIGNALAQAQAIAERVLGRMSRPAGSPGSTGAASGGPALPYRGWFWTWDHSTNWRVDVPGRQEYGGANAYFKPAEALLEDYRRVVDFASRHRINGVRVYGLLRDRHGGVETAKELSRYANARGVRILPGVGINSYGGIYYDGRHRFNLRTWLLDHPRAPRPAGTEPRTRQAHHHYADMACPSQPANQAWRAEAIQWLAEEFEIGGSDFETGEQQDVPLPAVRGAARERSRALVDRGRGRAVPRALRGRPAGPARGLDDRRGVLRQSARPGRDRPPWPRSRRRRSASTTMTTAATGRGCRPS